MMDEKKCFLNGAFNFFNGAWKVNEKPTYTRCNVYDEIL